MFSTLMVRVQTIAGRKRIRSARPPGGPGRQLNPADRRPRLDPGLPANLRDYDDLVGLRASVALRDLELDPLSLFEGAVAIRLDSREVDEDVLATVDGNEAVSLVRVEPLDGALSHSQQLPNCARASSPALANAEPVDREPVRAAACLAREPVPSDGDRK